MSVSGSEEALAVEEGYNLLDACSRLDHEPHVSLFREVLCEELDESVFHSWLTAQTHLFEALGQQAEEEVGDLVPVHKTDSHKMRNIFSCAKIISVV